MTNRNEEVEYYLYPFEEEWGTAASLIIKLPLAPKSLDEGLVSIAELVECFLSNIPRTEDGYICFTEEEAADILTNKVNSIIVERVMWQLEKEGNCETYVCPNGELLRLTNEEGTKILGLDKPP